VRQGQGRLLPGLRLLVWPRRLPGLRTGCRPASYKLPAKDSLRLSSPLPRGQWPWKNASWTDPFGAKFGVEQRRSLPDNSPCRIGSLPSSSAKDVACVNTVRACSTTTSSSSQYSIRPTPSTGLLLPIVVSSPSWPWMFGSPTLDPTGGGENAGVAHAVPAAPLGVWSPDARRGAGPTRRTSLPHRPLSGPSWSGC